MAAEMNDHFENIDDKILDDSRLVDAGEPSDFDGDVEEILKRQQAEQRQIDSENFELEGYEESDELGSEENEEHKETTGPTKFDLLKAHNPQKLEKACREIENKLIEPANKRQQANADVIAILSEAETKGFNREGIKLAHKFLKWATEKRDSFIGTFQIYTKAMGYSITGDLFYDSQYSEITSKFNFEFHQEVIIKTLDLEGKVFARGENANGKCEYKISYKAKNNLMVERWFPEKELKKK